MSRGRVQIGPDARGDLRKLTLRLRDEADAEVATRFAKAALAGFARIAEAPGIGPVVLSTDPAMAGLRKWTVRGFSKHLIFYRKTSTGVEIVRVLHGSQDWWALLDVS